MKPLLLLTLLAMIPRLSQAAPHAVSQKELAEKLRYYRSIKALQTKFHETKTLKDMKIQINSEGELTVTRPSKVVWKIIKPSALTVTLDDQSIQISSGQGEKDESYPMESGPRESLKILVAWMKLDPVELSQAYDVSTVSENTYRFLPKAGPKSPFLAMQMTIKPNSYVEKLEIEEASGDHLTIRFEKPRLEHIK